MSTVTPSQTTQTAPAGPGRAGGAPVQRVSATPAAPGGTGALANIDPVRLLRRYWPLLAAAAVVGAVLGTAGHFVLLRVYPMYTAQAIFECRPKPASVTATGEIGVQPADFERVIMTQASNMTSTEVLRDALRSGDVIATKWARQYYVNGNFQPERALPDLKDKVAARMVSQTYLLRLSMTWKDKNDVRTIVEAVANAYMQYQQASEQRISAERRQLLDTRRAEINRQLTANNRTRDQLLKDKKVTNLREGADAAEQQQSRITQDLVEARQNTAQTKTLLERLRNMQENNAVIPYPEDMQEQAKQDPVVLELTRQLTSLKVDEDSLIRQGYGDNHPAMQAVRQRIKATEAEMNAQTRLVLQRLYDARVEELSKAEQAGEAREKKLLADLEEVSARKQDLLAVALQVDQIESQNKQLTDELSQVTQAKQELEQLSNSVFDRVRLVSPAQTPNEVSFPKLAVMLPLGILLLTGLTATVVLLREIMDQRVKGPADVAMIPRLRVLGMVPDASEDPSRPGSVETAFRDTPGGVVTESFRQIRAPLVNKMDAEGLRTVLVLAGMPGSGATTVATNLAIACAGADEKVLLIDANFRRPSLHRVLGIEEGLGTADCLAGQAALPDTARQTSVANLSVLTAGSAGNRMVPERLSSEALSRLLADAAARYDRVFIDCPPAIVSGDGMAIANRCDAVVLVVRALSEKRGLVNRIRTQLSHARADLIGVVVNGVKSAAGGYFKRNIQATHEYHNNGRA